MHLHANAKLGLAGRHALVLDVELGRSQREAGGHRGRPLVTACKWWRRWREASDEERATLACLHEICAARRRSGSGPPLIAGENGHVHATVWRSVLRLLCPRPPDPRHARRGRTLDGARVCCFGN
jgi:hypothetical protein